MASNEDGKLGFFLYNNKYPAYSPYGLKSMAYIYPLIKEKVSVNTGSFIPGIYRVNPYKVKSVSAKLDLGYGVSNYADVPLLAAKKLAPYYIGKRMYLASKGQDAVVLIGDAWRGILMKSAYDSVTIRTADRYEQLSLQKAYGKLRQADLDLGETLGEYRETIEMLRSPLSGLKKFLLDDRSRNLRLLLALRYWDRKEVARLLGRTGLASLDAMTSTWLELRYGLRPLVMLVQDVIERVKSQKDDIIDPTKIRSVKSKLVFPVENTVETKFEGAYQCGVSSKVLVEDTYESFASVQYKQTVEASFLDSLGLTPRFLPEVAFALTRLSFVVDWIFSVGPWLSTLRINPGIQILGNTSGFKHTRCVTLGDPTLYCNWDGHVFEETLEAAMDLDKIEHRSYERKVNLSLSYLPHFTWGRTLDLWKVIDSISILWTPLHNHYKKEFSKLRR